MKSTPHFDVLSEAWIPVETLEGQQTLVGIRQALAQAHLFRCVSGDTPMVSYGIQRILLAFLQDAYAPEMIADIQSIIRSGAFDADKMESYYALCRAEGECFDLFDEKHPFLQCAMGDTGSVEKPVKLFSQWPAGNNHVHFNHTLEAEHTFTPVQCLQALCALPSFLMSYPNSKYCGINGIPPMYFLYAGKTLFETLALSMVSVASIGNLAYNTPPVAWRNHCTVPEKQPIAAVSLLHGLTQQPLRIELLPDEEGTIITGVCMSNGWQYAQVEQWTDPMVVYFTSDKGERRSLRPAQSRAVWRDMGLILQKGSLRLLQNAEKKLRALPEKPESFMLYAYGVVSKQKGAMLMPMNWLSEGVSISPFLLEAKEKAELLNQMLNMTDEAANTIAWVVKQTAGQIKSGKPDKRIHGRFLCLSEEITTLYLSHVQHALLSEMLPMLQAADTMQPNWEEPLMLTWGRTMLDSSKRAVQQVMNGITISGSTLQWRALMEQLLFGTICKKLTKGGWRRDE